MFQGRRNKKEMNEYSLEELIKEYETLKRYRKIIKSIEPAFFFEFVDRILSILSESNKKVDGKCLINSDVCSPEECEKCVWFEREKI